MTNYKELRNRYTDPNTIHATTAQLRTMAQTEALQGVAVGLARNLALKMQVYGADKSLIERVREEFGLAKVNESKNSSPRA